MIKNGKSVKATTFAALASVLALSIAAPGSAQAHANDYSGHRQSVHEHSSSLDFRRLERRIDRGVETGDLTRREARHLYIQLQDLRQLARYYDRNGMSRRQARELEYRYQHLSDRVAYQKHDRDRRDYSWR